jgi:hypothetical protein
MDKETVKLLKGLVALGKIWTVIKVLFALLVIYALFRLLAR